jgi:hypothetical protein
MWALAWRMHTAPFMTHSLPRSLAVGIVAIACAWAATGCAPVAPYQRAALAHPTMSADDLATGIESHVRAVSEGGGGGLGGGGGGCGCN